MSVGIEAVEVVWGIRELVGVFCDFWRPRRVCCVACEERIVEVWSLSCDFREDTACVSWLMRRGVHLFTL